MREQIRGGWRGLVTLAVFSAVFGLLIAAGQVGDLVIRTLIWTTIVTTSALLLLQRSRRDRRGLLSQSDTLLRRWQRWAMDESNRR
jgi:hypothetical protein